MLINIQFHQLINFLSRFNNDEKFTKLDLSDAYLQVELDEQSECLVVIHTPLEFGFTCNPEKGLFFQDEVSYLGFIIDKNEKHHDPSRVEAIISKINYYGKFIPNFSQKIGRTFELATDHQPLLTIFNPTKGIPVTIANRLQRWAIYLMRYNYNIHYKSTKLHGNADELSRLPISYGNSFIDSDAIQINYIQQRLIEQWP
ncbi:unnamed protein product [Rotaria magnacalcarata]|uniref:Reverse transcriptase RNase H-like domain-containing protein n=1 Tax=Rotaria magnacalcarata TaxID=392030 RepID=A0A820DWL2_9BILA|nr:unnamed protein product [Rotaria magnacalcarata]CAF4240291.1 unnamed protein product [Rotaria magnacalcarata]